MKKFKEEERLNKTLIQKLKYKFKKAGFTLSYLGELLDRRNKAYVVGHNKKLKVYAVRHDKFPDFLVIVDGDSLKRGILLHGKTDIANSKSDSVNIELTQYLNSTQVGLCVEYKDCEESMVKDIASVMEEQANVKEELLADDDLEFIMYILITLKL